MALAVSFPITFKRKAVDYHKQFQKVSYHHNTSQLLLQDERRFGFEDAKSPQTGV
jgi:hypothetical protein